MLNIVKGGCDAIMNVVHCEAKRNRISVVIIALTGNYQQNLWWLAKLNGTLEGERYW